MAEARDTAAAEVPRAAQNLPDAPLSSPLLAMQGIVKRYGANTALNGIDFEVHGGEIHALLGENGAGKSTLMHVLSGLTRPDAGQIRWEGQPVRVNSPNAARALGIAMVHQHFTLVPAFTVAENLALDTQPLPQPASLLKKWSSRFHYTASQAAANALQRAEALGWHLDPTARMEDLSVGAQQRVEIVKALATDAQLLIFDEPTAVLAGDEVEELFQVLRRLRDEGRAIILIAHKLAEILAAADRVTVLRRGSLVATCPVAETDAGQLAAWMVGDALAAPGRPGGDSAFSETERQKPGSTSTEEKRAAFIANDVKILGDRGEQAVRGVSLSVRQGEIFGIGGVDGNGQAELAEALVGLRELQSGTMTWNGEAFRVGKKPKIAYIPQDRRRAGLAVTMTVGENLLFEAVHDPAFRHGAFLRMGALHQLALNLIQNFDIRTPGPAIPVSFLSGGNQQKIIVARALRSQPDWIVAMNPTRGLDIGATRFVHAQLRQARARGAAIVLISADLDELFALSDRAAILSGGALANIRSDGHDPTQIGLLLGGMEQRP